LLLQPRLLFGLLALLFQPELFEALAFLFENTCGLGRWSRRWEPSSAYAVFQPVFFQPMAS